MTVEITAIEFGKEKIIITATNLESILTDDLYAEIDPEPVNFEFTIGTPQMKYLYKICQSQSRCRQAKSMGEKLEKLTGVILYISDNFRAK